MIDFKTYLRKLFRRHSPNEEFSKGIKISKDEKSDLYDRIDNIPINQKYPPNMTRAFLGLEPIIHIGEDEQVITLHENKHIIIQFDSILKAETIELLREDIQNQIKENGFAVVDGRCKIVEFDNSKYLIETK